MLIKSLTLNNFRQFIDNQEITFSTDKEKKVTFIMAESGVGKTTLIQSFKWILYDDSDYTCVLNGNVKKNMLSGTSAEVSGKLIINHDGRDYVISRKQTFYKVNKAVRYDPSDIKVEYKDDDGISKQEKGKNADSIIKKIMHKDLFEYFFLEGENLKKVGEQMARGKSSSNSDFVKAIKGLLGFGFLYEEKRHLSRLIDEYDKLIARNTSNASLAKTINEISEKQQQIEYNKERILNIDKNITSFDEKRNIISDKLIEIGEIASDQQRVKMLRLEISNLWDNILKKRKYIFDKFSSNSFYFITNDFKKDIDDILKKSDSLDKGIPGMNVEAINFMLETHKCICGEELIEGSDHWKMLKDLLNYLPPNNIGYELKSFSKDISEVEKQSKNFYEEFLEARRELSEYNNNYNSKVDEVRKLNEKIGNVSVDVSELKNQEQDYIAKITELRIEKRRCTENISRIQLEITKLNEQKTIYEKLDEKTSKYQKYRFEANYLKEKLEAFIIKREKNKKSQLAENINDIFKEFYNEKIKFILDSEYGIHIEIDSTELSDDFTSGGQDVAIALAFIGAIIKVKSEKESDGDDSMADNDDIKESYPLVMDAPTSNFGMKQMKSFSEIMPKITDQIIVFINDKDGPILKEKLNSKIGLTWSLHKYDGDSYHTIIEEGVE